MILEHRSFSPKNQVRSAIIVLAKSKKVQQREDSIALIGVAMMRVQEDISHCNFTVVCILVVCTKAVEL